MTVYLKKSLLSPLYTMSPLCILTCQQPVSVVDGKVYLSNTQKQTNTVQYAPYRTSLAAQVQVDQRNNSGKKNIP